MWLQGLDQLLSVIKRGDSFSMAAHLAHVWLLLSALSGLRAMLMWFWKGGWLSSFHVMVLAVRAVT